MNFEKFNSTVLAETALFLHLAHPATGDLLWNDAPANTEPCGFMVIGTESRTAQSALKKVQKTRLQLGKKDDQQTLADLHESLVAAAIPLISGLRNIEMGDKPATLDDVRAILMMQTINGQEKEKCFAEQVTAFASKRANWLGNESSE